MAYLININESQRLELLKLVKTINTNEPGENIDPITGEHPLNYWEGMLTHLPKDEAEQPGIIHGFCL